MSGSVGAGAEPLPNVPNAEAPEHPGARER